MFEHDDDEFGFWRDEPTRPLERIQARLHHPHLPGDDTAPTTRLPLVRRPVTVGPPGSRRHGHTQPVAVIESVVEPVVEPFAEPVTHRTRPSSVPVDPLLRRIGTLAMALALCVPVALSLRADDPASVRAGEPPSSPTAADDVTSLPEPSATAAQAVVQTVAQAPVPDSQASQAAAADTAAVPSAAATAATPAPTAQASVAPATAAAPSVAQPKAVDAASTSCSKRYTVVAGDYWILIAKKVSVSLSELLAANNASPSSMLYPGRSVCLPANASAPTTVPVPTSPPTTAKPAPTAPPTTKPPATTVPPVPPKATYTPAEVTQIIREVWPDDQETEAIRIATRESRLDPMAKNYCCYGLFQIYFNVHKSWLATIGVTNATQLFDPRVNAYAALVLYVRSGGWGPWKL